MKNLQVKHLCIRKFNNCKSKGLISLLVNTNSGSNRQIETIECDNEFIQSIKNELKYLSPETLQCLNFHTLLIITDFPWCKNSIDHLPERTHIIIHKLEEGISSEEINYLANKNVTVRKITLNRILYSMVKPIIKIANNSQYIKDTFSFEQNCLPNFELIISPKLIIL